MKTPHLSTEQKMEALFRQSSISAEDYNNLTPEEKIMFEKEQTRLLKQLEGKELTAMIDKMLPTLPANANEAFWEIHHDKICSVINELLQQNNRMPSKAEIARETGLSVVTVRKHLKEYATNQLNIERKEQFKFIEPALMAVLYNRCIQGDVNAMRFYFEVTGLTNERKRAGASVIENQHNYIQINNLKLSQEEIQKLSPKQLKQIEAIVKSNSAIEKRGKE